MLRSHTVLVWSHLLPKKTLVVVVSGGDRPNLMDPGAGL